MRGYPAKGVIGVAILLIAFSGCVRERPRQGFFLPPDKAGSLVDYYLTGDWVAAQTTVDSIGVYEGEVLAAMGDHELPQSTRDTFSFLVFRLKSLSQERKEPIRAALVANQISGMLIDLENFYERRYPESLDRMSYLGREIVLLAQEPSDYGLMNTRLTQLEQTWAALRPEIVERNGGSLAAQVDQVISDLKQRISPVRMVNGGNRILDLAREMKVLYE
ncbi:MAG: hypothetical protein ACYC9O_10075 [Candidatus Latescibacterota bacterium]